MKKSRKLPNVPRFISKINRDLSLSLPIQVYQNMLLLLILQQYLRYKTKNINIELTFRDGFRRINLILFGGFKMCWKELHKNLLRCWEDDLLV